MKQKIFLLIFIVSTFFTSCSKSDDNLSYGEGVSDFPILLNSGKSFIPYISTRGMIDSLSEVSSLGVFCLATGKTGSVSSDKASDVDWNVLLDNTIDNYSQTTNGVYWNNLECTTVDLGNDSTKIEVMPDQEYARYYPITSWYKYTFYGYYPYSEDYSRTSDSITVDFSIDGQSDILWGRSEKIDDPYAYSARYLRVNHKTSAHMDFNHALAQLQFYAIPAKSWNAEADSDDYTSVKKLCIKDVRIVDVNTNLRMTVAHRTNDERSGLVYPIDDTLSDFILKDNDDQAIAENPVKILTQYDADGTEVADTVRIGDCIMLSPNVKEYYMTMALCDSANYDIEYNSEKKMTIRLSGDRTFQPGYIYRVYLSVSGVTQIAVDASLEEWKIAEDDESLKFEFD